jgi:hypothetical protein
MRFSRTSAVATAVLLAAGGMSAIPAAASDAPPTARALKIRCVSHDADGTGVIKHRFRVPRRAWEVVLRDLSCTSKGGRIQVQVSWRRGAGSRDGMARYLERVAASKPGFRLREFDTNSAKFKAPERRTRMYDYSYRTDNGRRRVVGFGDRLTLMRVSAPSDRWGVGKKVVRKARTTMVRRFSS